MEEKMKNKIEAVLKRVKEPVSGLTLSELGLVEKIRHIEEKRKLIVFINRLGYSKACCMLLNMNVLSRMEKTIAEELKKEFPHLSIEFA